MVTGCKATPGCIAYVGISYQTQALQSGLGYAQLRNLKGQYVTATASSIAAEAAAFAPKTPPNGTISLIYGSANGGYPIVNYEYAIVSDHQSSSNTAKNDPLAARVGGQQEVRLVRLVPGPGRLPAPAHEGPGADAEADPEHQVGPKQILSST